MKLKRSVFLVPLKNEQGFTLLSALLCLAILFISLPLFAFLLKITHYSTNYNQQSIQLFFHYFQEEVIKASDIKLDRSQIQLYMPDGNEILFEKYQDQIRRRVNRQGHEVYLRNIEQVDFQKVQYGMKMAIRSLQGEVYEKTIIFYQK